MFDIDFILITATDQEQQNLRALIQPEKVETNGTRPWVYGQYAGYAVLGIAAGIGCVNTAHALTLALSRYKPRCVIQIGIGGAYLSSGLSVGDIGLADEEYYGDMGVMTPDGWQGMDFIGIPVLENPQDKTTPIFNRFVLDEALVSRVQSSLASADWGAPRPRIKSGHFITVQQCSGVQTIGDALASRYNGICESMEGAAAAHICMMMNAPFIEVRSISNLVTDRDFSQWDIPLAISRAQAAFQTILTCWDD